MEGDELRRDKNDVVLPISRPRYSAERHLEQRGYWVVVAALPRKGEATEAVPVLDYEERTYMQRYENLAELQQLAYRNSAVRVAGGWALNLLTGDTVRLNPKR